MARIYHSGGFEEHTEQSLLELMLKYGLKPSRGIITAARILERKRLSNKGNALECSAKMNDGLHMGINIGGNPIGTGYNTYIPFLEEMGCSKFCGLYRLRSLTGRDIIILENPFGAYAYMSPKEFLSLNPAE